MTLRVVSSLGRRVRLAAAITVSLTPGISAQTLEPTVKDTTNVRMVMLTMRGDMGRGAYQGGLNWALVEIARRSAFDTAFRNWAGKFSKQAVPTFYIAAAAGGSSGSVNPLLTAIEWCRATMQTNPEESSFWKYWVWTGWDQLMMDQFDSPDEGDALFDRRFTSQIVKDTLEVDLRKVGYLRKSCSLPLALNAARYPARPPDGSGAVSAYDPVTVPFTFQTDSSGRPSIDDLAGFPRGSDRIARLSRPGAFNDATVARVMPAVEAASAFGVAFSPRSIFVDTQSAADRERAAEDRERAADKKLAAANKKLAAANKKLAAARKKKAAADSARAVAEIQQAGADSAQAAADRAAARTELALARKACVLKADGFVCTPDKAGFFFDGGVSEGELRAVAYDLYRCSISACPEAGTRRAMTVSLSATGRRDADGRTAPSSDAKPITTSFISVSLRSPAATNGSATASATQLPLQGTDTVALHATNRFQAIAGDQLGSFGALLARPLREMDFYTGAFDAVYFAADKWFCPTLAPREHRQCVSKMLLGVICDSMFELTDAARAGMAALYQAEIDSVPSTCSPAAVDSRTAFDDALALAVVYRTIVRANDVVRRTLEKGDEDPFACSRRRPIDEFMCRDGFRVLTDSLDEHYEALDFLSNDSTCSRAFSRNQACRVGRTALDVAGNPFAPVDEVARESTRRLLLATRGKGRWGRVAKELNLYYTRSSDLNGRAWTTPMIPVRDWSIRKRELPLWNAVRILPFFLTTSTGTGSGSIEGGWEPRWFTRCGLNYFIPVGVGGFNKEFDLAGGGRGDRWLRTVKVGLGAGYVFEGSLLHSLQVKSTLSFRQPHVWQRAKNLDDLVGVEATGGLFYGRVRLGARYNAKNDRGDKVSLVVGLNDAASNVYWAGRFLVAK